MAFWFSNANLNPALARRLLRYPCRCWPNFRPSCCARATTSLTLNGGWVRVQAMSTVQLGPSAGLQRDFDSDHLFDRTLPQLMNAAGTGLAVFMLLIWSQRRREAAYGLFSLLWLLVSLRNFAYYAQANPLPGDLAGGVFFFAQGESAVLLGAFAVAMSLRPWPRFQRLLWALAAVMPLLALVGTLLGALGRGDSAGVSSGLSAWAMVDAGR